jgi:phosphatidylglycerol---prolipoprotein diacylglyceryl transferase
LRLYGDEKPGGKDVIAMLFSAAANSPVNFDDLGFNPIALELGPLVIRWYSLAYIVGIFAGYWLVKRMLARRAGAPMAERHVDDLLFWAMLGVILGGRLGYVLFYNLREYLADPVSIFRIWDGGMSFHGGVIGVTLACLWVARRSEPKLSFLRVCDYVACVYPFGHLLGRLANFVNGELWGRATDSSWGMIFPASESIVARHPSQLYQAALEGALLFAIMMYAFWRTDARYYPGRLVGLFTLGMGVARFVVEFYREPDSQLLWLQTETGLSMGQWLTIPMILLGAWLMWTSGGRRQRVEPIAGTSSVA